MSIRLYNTLTNQVETFKPLAEDGKTVTFYSCGPTVYDYAHIGNFRSFLNADVLRRTLELLGYTVHQIMNITDVGHMTEDDVADGGGSDKMEVAASRLAEAKKSGKLPEGVNVDPSNPYAIADFYAAAFIEDARRLGMRMIGDFDRDESRMPRPTRFVPQMIALIERLIANDHAYVASDGVVYFDVQSFDRYGELSGNTPDQIRSGEGGRVNEATQAIKRHPADFMLWKPDDKHLMKWPSPWGEGYPGWHLECSCMAMALIGDKTNGVIDIHSGGEDNIFPHHECEIAQTCAATGEDHFARYWFHTRFLIVEGEKMSKSKGNFFTVRDLMSRGATPAAIRLELIKTHYADNANFTMTGLKDAQRQIDRWSRLHDWLTEHAAAPAPESRPLHSALEGFTQALSNNLNVAGAIGELSSAATQYNVTEAPASSNSSETLASELDALNKMNSVLGVLDIQHSADLESDDIDRDAIDALVTKRNEARASKDWAEADRIRDELLDMGIEIKDGADGTAWTRILN